MMGQLLGPRQGTEDSPEHRGGLAARLGSKLVCHVAFADVCVARFGLASKNLHYETKQSLA